MSLWQAYRNLSPKAKAGFGVALVAWGLIGPMLSDTAEAKLGLTPSDEDKAALDRLTPRVHTVPREKPASTSPSS